MKDELVDRATAVIERLRLLRSPLVETLGDYKSRIEEERYVPEDPEMAEENARHFEVSMAIRRKALAKALAAAEKELK